MCHGRRAVPFRIRSRLARGRIGSQLTSRPFPAAGSARRSTAIFDAREGSGGMIVSEPAPESTQTAASGTRHFYPILFPAYLVERVEAVLDDVGVPGHSHAPDVHRPRRAWSAIQYPG